jgi:hypothetical protein
MASIKLEKEEQEILQELVEAERSNFVVVEDENQLPVRVKRYRDQLDCLSEKIQV